MVRDYELMLVIHPDLDEEGVKTVTDGVHTLVENAGGTVTKSTKWGRRHLAYEIQKCHEGVYIIDRLQLEGEKVKDIERALAINEKVLRHLLVLSSTTQDMSSPDSDELDREDEDDDMGHRSSRSRTPRDEDDREEVMAVVVEEEIVEEREPVAIAEEEE